jgi:hypothetical protein
LSINKNGRIMNESNDEKKSSIRTGIIN